MAMRVVRTIIAVLAGVFLGSLVIYALQPVAQLLFPPPLHYDPADPDIFRKLSSAHQGIVLIPILVAYTVGALLGGFFTGILSKGANLFFPVITGMTLFMFTLVNLLNFYHPTWFWGSSILLYFGFSYAGGLLAAKVKRA